VIDAFNQPLEPASLSWERSNLNVSAAFEKLPADVVCAVSERLPVPSILHLLSTSKHIRELLRSRVNNLISTSIQKHAPHLLPYRVEGAYGSTEVEWWDAKVQEAQGQGKPFPWLSYVRACKSSPSMRNRERIWGICKQLERVAKKKGLLP
jgi:hypothetical protein